MRNPAVQSTGNGNSLRTDLAMTSMIDVVFLLLVFFVWTSSFDAPEADLLSGVSTLAQEQDGASQTPPEERPPIESEVQWLDEVMITISMRSGTPMFGVGNRTFDSMDTLREHLGHIASFGIDPPIIIDPDSDVAIRAAVEVLDQTRSVGLTRAYFAVD